MTVAAAQYEVCFIACHGGPADHFATFAENLAKDGISIHIYASGIALKKFQDRGVSVQSQFSLEGISSVEQDALAVQIAKTCSTASVVITDVGHSFDIKIQKALISHAIHTLRLAYYDNPEPYVPRGYSEVASEVMSAADGILFANFHLATTPLLEKPGTPIPLETKRKIGIGYYPIKQAESIATRRQKEQRTRRQELFSKLNLTDNGQKIVVYFGGNNDEYFTKAFPAFLSLLGAAAHHGDLSTFVFILQQHPGAKTKNIDGELMMKWAKDLPTAPTIRISDGTSDDAQIVADAAMYYQTSMGPQFVLAGIPTIQIGHDTYHDILVRNKLSPSVTDKDQLLGVLDDIAHQKTHTPKETVLDGIGFKENWLQLLKNALQEDSHKRLNK
jgi:hypothetical protein